MSTEKNSKLYAYVLTLAEATAREDGCEAVTATHLVAATLTAFAEAKNGTLAAAVADGSEDELRESMALLAVDPDTAAELSATLRAATREEGYDAEEDGAAYTKAAAMARIDAVSTLFNGGEDIASLTDCLKGLLGVLPPVLRRYKIGAAKAKKKTEPKKPAADPFAAISGSAFSDLLGGGTPAAEAPAEDSANRPAAPVAEAPAEEDDDEDEDEGSRATASDIDRILAEMAGGTPDPDNPAAEAPAAETVEPAEPKADAPAAEAPADEAPATEPAAEPTTATKPLSGVDKIFAELMGGAPMNGGDDDDEDGDDAPVDPVMTPETGAGVLTDLMTSARDLQKALLSKVVGQDHAVRAFVSGYFQARLTAATGQTKKRSEAVFLFAGPPGVGKTYLAETAAEALGLPFKRFDMSEYSDHQAGNMFVGTDRGFSGSHEGAVTGFVAEHKKCVLLFDEIEKAHLNVIYLFLQILDAGRLRDAKTDKEVSFADTVMIFTTNVGKNLYEDPSITNLATLPRKKILQAIAAEMDPHTHAPRFPAAICSRFASGNVLMFNHLGADNLHFVASAELKKHTASFAETSGIAVSVDPRVPSSIIFAEGGRADARTVRGRAAVMFHDEIYELLRLLADGREGAVGAIKKIDFTVALEGTDPEIARMFKNPEADKILVFAAEKTVAAVRRKLRGIEVFGTESLDEAKDLLFNHDFSLLLCDVRTGVREGDGEVLNAEDILSDGQDFLRYARERVSIPLFLLQKKEGEISREEQVSFGQLGVSDLLTLTSDGFADAVRTKCEAAYQQENILRLAKSNRILSYKTKQTVSADGASARISLFNFRLTVAPDVEEAGSLLDTVSRPTVRFGDVIGAEDAKAELGYFVNYLKNPTKFLRQGLRPPKGVLLYGPPGTGKTMLAKAMAGESNVTFMVAEGNQFLKKWQGEGAGMVHDLFRTARKYAPTIVFIDEIDAIGRSRDDQGNQGTSGDVLTAFLAEMDGFKRDDTKPVFVLAATNYDVEADSGSGRTLDAALLRRFDRRIYIGLPKKEERRRFMEMKLAANPAITLSPEQIENIAVRSTGMSLAELDSVFELALRSAVRTSDGTVGDEAFEEAFETFNYGEKRTEKDQAELLSTARHEAGHALLCWMNGECPSYLTIVARGDHGGYMQHADGESKGTYSHKELLFRIRTSLAGRAAEIAYYGPEDGLTTGASGDLQSATRLATRIIGSYGMDAKMGLACLDPHSDALAGALRTRVNEILAEELVAAINTINENRAAMDAIVAELMAKNYLKGDEIDAIFKAHVPSGK